MLQTAWRFGCVNVYSQRSGREYAFMRILLSKNEDADICGNVCNFLFYGAVGSTVYRIVGKLFYAFPYAVNGIVHSGMGSYAYFHNVIKKVCLNCKYNEK